ncbi:sporulation protein YqfC [Gracilibacillus kekensis]
MRETLKTVFTNTFDLPSEVTLELPRITMIGSIHAYIENHQGLIVFSETELLLKIHQGNVRINGEGFVLKMMIDKDILLEGTIKDVKFEDE